MPREMKPEAAAVKIINLIKSGEATNANDAVAQHPELAPGREFMTKAVSEGTPREPIVAASTGSGPMLLHR